MQPELLYNFELDDKTHRLGHFEKSLALEGPLEISLQKLARRVGLASVSRPEFGNDGFNYDAV